MTAHFQFSKLIESETARRLKIVNAPNPKQTANLYRVMELLEQVRHILWDKPIYATSGFRCPALNNAVGGSNTSAHLDGLAVDFVCPDVGKPRHIVARLANSSLNFDQLIEEHSGDSSWVHIGLARDVYRREVLVYQDGQYQPWSK